MNDITFIYVVGGDEQHYLNLQRSIKSVKNIYPDANILVGDFDNKINFSDIKNLKIIDLSHIKIDKSKTYKHIIWQYKFYICLLTESKYNLYLDSDTVLVNPIDELIEESNGNFTIAQHFWVPTIKEFKNKTQTDKNTFSYLEKLNLKDEMKFCAAGVFLFEKNEINLTILKETFDLHNTIYDNQDYIEGIYDEPILNSILQRYANNSTYYNGSLNHCSMINMPLKLENNILYGKNEFDLEFKKVICLHCNFFKRNPSAQYQEPIKSIINNLFNTI